MQLNPQEIITATVAFIGALISFSVRSYQKTLDIQFSKLDEENGHLIKDHEKLQDRLRTLELTSIHKDDFFLFRTEIIEHLTRIEKKIDRKVDK